MKTALLYVVLSASLVAPCLDDRPLGDVARDARAAKSAKVQAATELLQSIPQVRQQTGVRLSKFQLLALIMGGMDAYDLGPELRSRGIDFQPSENDLAQLRSVGAETDLINAVLSAPSIPAPGAVDDEPASTLLVEANDSACRNQPRRGVQILVALLARNPNVAALYVTFGNILREAEDWDHVVDAYTKALELQPNLAYAHGQLSFAYYKLHNAPRCLSEAQKMVELQPQNPDSHKYLGLALDVNDQNAAAVAAYKKALSLKPDYAWVYHDMSLVLSKQNDVDGAIDAQRHAVTLAPRNPAFLQNLAALYYNSGRYRDALEIYRKKVLAAPRDFDAHSGLARSLQHLGQYEDALAEYRTALELSPRDEPTREAIAALTQKVGQK